MGNARPQLKVHLNGALNTGSSVDELKEVVLQMSVYAGFPSAINGMNALKEVLQERKQHGVSDNKGFEERKNAQERLQLGKQQLSAIAPGMVEKLQSTYDGFAPELTQFILEYGYGDIFSRENLDRQYRQIATIAALTALGNARPQLKFHIRAGLNVGLSEEGIKEIMLLMTVYSGFPSAINGMNALKEVLGEGK